MEAALARRARQLLIEHGWTRGSVYRLVERRALRTRGALRKRSEEPGADSPSVERLMHDLSPGGNVVSYNDAPTTTKKDVLELLEWAEGILIAEEQ